MGAALAVIPWTKAVRRLSVLVEFSIFWKARLFLVIIGAFWVVRPRALLQLSASEQPALPFTLSVSVLCSMGLDTAPRARLSIF